MLIFRPELELKREPASGEYYINFSELSANLWHDRYTPEKLEALGIQFLPVERFPEYFSQFDEIVSSDASASSLSPLDKDYCPETSRIMVINGELAGWCLSRELSEDVARISPVYVVKKFRPKRAGAIMEGHVMNILKQKYPGIRLFYDKWNSLRNRFAKQWSARQQTSFLHWRRQRALNSPVRRPKSTSN